MEKINAGVFFIIMLFLCNTGMPSVSAEDLPELNIGLVLDGPWERNHAVTEMLRKEIYELTHGEYATRIPADGIIIANWTAASIRAALEKLLNDPGIDMVIAGGVIASQEACLMSGHPKPVIAPVILDPGLQGIPYQDGVSGVKNLCYVHSPSRLMNELRFFHEIFPFRNLILLTSEAFYEAVPQFADNAKAMVSEIGVNLTIVQVSTSADEALSCIPQDADGVFVGTLFQMPDTEFQKLVQGIIERRLPSFALWGKIDVEKGILAGLLPDTYIPRLTRRTALIVQRILMGQLPGEIQVSFPPRQRLTINMKTAREIGIYPTWAVLTEAELIHPIREETERVFTLEQVMREVLDTNLDLAGSKTSVAAGAQEPYIARSILFPQVNTSLLGLIIDDDRAGASLGNQAERTVSGSVAVSQLLFSDPAWTNNAVQKELQKIREYEHEVLKLDIIGNASTSYLNVLRAKTYERIQRENLHRSRENLELAEVRKAAGYSGPADVYRWESQIATNRKDVIQAGAERNIAEIELNRILNKPLEQPFSTEENGLKDVFLLKRHDQLLKYSNNPQDFKIFRNFMVEEALQNSPELKALDTAISAQKRLLQSARNAFWAPTVALQGELTHRFSETGAGTDNGFSSSLPPEFDFNLPEADDTDWNMVFSVSFPLFRGNAKSAEKQQAIETLVQLELEKQAATERIEQRIRSALHIAGASWAAIQQTEKARETARKNLDLVVNAYSRGAVSIIQLIDAQNAALVAEQASSNSFYDFLIDFMAVERALAKIDLFRTEEEREGFFKRLDQFFIAKRNIMQG